MYSFFKKKESPVELNHDILPFGFSLEQRAGILSALVALAKSDGEAHPKELQLVEQARKLLGIGLDDPTFARFLNADNEMLISILSSLDRQQKEWFIASLHSIILADGKVEESETEFIKVFCDKMGISEFDYMVLTQR